MKAAAFDYFAPTTISEAVSLLSSLSEARLLAGGQSLVPMMATRLARPEALIDLNRIAELTVMTEADGELCIGSMVRQAALLASPRVAALVPLLTETLSNVGHPPTRARGTIGGSLANADPAAELPVAMVALDAGMMLQGPKGVRRVEAADFFVGMFETALQDNELLVEIRIPAPIRAGTSFLEIARRKGDFAIVAVAARIWLDRSGCCGGAAIVFGGVGPVPVRCLPAEQILRGRIPDDAAIADAVDGIPADVVESISHGGGRAYRQKVLRVLVRRALETARARCESTR